MKNDDKKPGANLVLAQVASIEAARAAREAEIAPLELFEPTAIKLQDDDHHITACDGEQTYVWLATKKPGKKYRVVEVYPGMSKRSTLKRSARSAQDLVLLGDYETIEEVIAELAEIIFEDLEEVGTGTN